MIRSTDFSSYVDDNTIFDSGKCIVDVISSLQKSSENGSPTINERKTDKWH